MNKTTWIEDLIVIAKDPIYEVTKDLPLSKDCPNNCIQGMVLEIDVYDNTRDTTYTPYPPKVKYRCQDCDLEEEVKIEITSIKFQPYYYHHKGIDQLDIYFKDKPCITRDIAPWLSVMETKDGEVCGFHLYGINNIIKEK